MTPYQDKTMKHVEEEIKSIKCYHAQMWELVENQVNKAFDALKRMDKQLAHEILAREKMVNAQELVIDQHCENFIALFNPVAIDLRFVISLLKINNNLERIGDFAESIALFVIYNQSDKIDPKLWNDLKMDIMTQTARDMLAKSRQALALEDSTLASNVLLMDDVIDALHRDSVSILAQYIVAHTSETAEMLHLHGVIRRIERIGDRVSNIAEDIVFFVDAKELRHIEK